MTGIMRKGLNGPQVWVTPFVLLNAIINAKTLLNYLIYRLHAYRNLLFIDRFLQSSITEFQIKMKRTFNRNLQWQKFCFFVVIPPESIWWRPQMRDYFNVTSQLTFARYRSLFMTFISWLYKCVEFRLSFSEYYTRIKISRVNLISLPICCTGKVVVYTNWYPGRLDPDNHWKEDCVAMALNKYSGRWEDRDCEETRGFICQFGKQLETTTIELPKLNLMNYRQNHLKIRFNFYCSY